MKNEEIYDYFYEKIEKDEEIMDIEGEDFYNKITFNSFISIFDNLDSFKSYDLELSKTIKSLIKDNNFEEIYSIIKKEYLYRYIKINVKSTEFPKYLNRIMLIPLRTTVLEMMIAVLSTLDTLGYHLVQLYKKDISFITPIDKSDSGYSAIDNYLINIIDLNKVKLWYDYGEDYQFDISFGNITYLDEFVPFKIIKFKGRGIIEDNKEALYSFLLNGDNEYEEEYELSKYFSDTLEDINDKSLSEYDSLVMTYLGLIE